MVFKGITNEVTWEDGTREELEIGRHAEILLNGEEIYAWGLLIEYEKEHCTEAAVESILNRCQEDGIRFMSISFTYWDDMAWCEEQVKYWYPRLYSHKMWAQLNINRWNAYDFLNVDGQFERHAGIIDYVCANPLWAEMTFSLCTYWIYDWYASIQEPPRTDEEVTAYCEEFWPLIKTKVQQSALGDIPISGKPAQTGAQFHGSTAMCVNCDFPVQDRYPRLDANDFIDHSIEDPIFLRLYEELWRDAGLTGNRRPKLWFVETGCRPFGQGDYASRPASLIFNLRGADWFDSCLAIGWQMTAIDQPQWAHFNHDGTPKQAYIDLAPYFPRTTPIKQLHQRRFEV